MAETPNTFMLLLRLGLSLGLVLALVGAVTWVLKRKGMLRPGSGSVDQGLQVVDRKSLGKRASVVVARIGDVSVLLGVTDQHVNVLAQAPTTDGTWSAGSPPDLAAGVGPAPIEVASEDQIDVRTPPRPAPGPRRCTIPGASSARELTTGSRWTGTRVGADGAPTTPTGMSFVEALKELTVRKS